MVRISSMAVAVAVAVAACGVAAALVSQPAAARPARHFIVVSAKVADLGTLGGASSTAQDINDKGVIVGSSTTAASDLHAYVYSAGIMNDIGPSIGRSFSAARGINNSGYVVGWYFDEFGATRAFRYHAGAVNSLFGPLGNTPSENTDAMKINGSGASTGYAVSYSPYNQDSVVWSYPTGLTLMPTLTHDDLGFDINTSGSVAGYANSNVPWKWTVSGGVVVNSQAVPAPGAGYGDGQARALNDRGEVVGYFRVPSLSGNRAFYWDGASLASKDLGTFPTGYASTAEDINELEFIAGHANERTPTSTHAVVWEVTVFAKSTRP